MDERETVALGLSARTAVYSLMQALFGREPQESVVASLASPELLQVTSLFFDGEPLGGLAGGCCADAAVDGDEQPAGAVLRVRVGELQAAAQRCANGGAEALDALSSAYARLFVGPRRPEAAPWESAHRGEDDTLFQPSTLEVRKAYVAHGLIPSRYPRIADDHLAIELGFLASLGQRAAQAFEQGDAEAWKVNVSASREFLRDHVRPWLPSFCQALDQASCGDLYREAARALESFTQVDASFLETASLS